LFVILPLISYYLKYIHQYPMPFSSDDRASFTPKQESLYQTSNTSRPLRQSTGMSTSNNSLCTCP